MTKEQKNHSKFMIRCLELAVEGLGHVSPNPLVGAVIVHEGEVIGEGYHQRYGEAHAEVNAIKDVSSKELLKESTLYVSLEPCSHFGKTPPCVQAIIEAGIPRVVFGMSDPNPDVPGAGKQILEQAGVHVTAGIEEDRCKEHNIRFITNMVKQRPYVILKWAQTEDGFIAKSDYTSKWISSEESRSLVHKWRSEEDAVLVGTTTALKDDPQLNVRLFEGRDPTRVVIDRDSKIPNSQALFDGSQRTIVISEKEPTGSAEWIKWPEDSDKFWDEAFEGLYNKGIGSVIIEGGSHTLRTIIEQNIWDEVRLFKSKTIFGSGIQAPEQPRHTPAKQEEIGVDTLETYRA